MYLLCDAFCTFSSFTVCSVEVEKQNGCQIIFFNGDQPATVVPPGTCFLGPVQYLDPCNMTEVSTENILNYLIWENIQCFLQLLQSERDNFLGIQV